MVEKKDRISKCRYSFLKIQGGHYCIIGGHGNVKNVTSENCEACEKFKNRYIEYPIEVSKINSEMTKYWNDKECGQLVKVRPCGEEYGDKTYIGILLGDLPLWNHITHNEETRELNVGVTCNPAIFVPELKKITFGIESWWERIETPEELKDITDKDIEDVWYVKLLNEMVEKDNEQQHD